MEVINKSDADLTESANRSGVIPPGAGKGGNVVIGTLNVFLNPIRKRHEKHYRDSKFHLAADIVLALTVIILAAVLAGAGLFVPESEVELSGRALSGAVMSGRTETFELTFANNGKAGLDNVRLAVRYPETFALSSATPGDGYDKRTNTFSLGNLASGANGKVKLSGTVTGQVGRSQNMAFTLSYERNHRDGQALYSLIYNIEKSSLSGDFSLPQPVYTDSELALPVKIENHGDKELDNISLRLDPEAFALSAVSGNDAAALTGNTINIRRLEAGQKLEFILHSAFNSETGAGEAVLSGYLAYQGNDFKQFETRYAFEAKQPRFSVNITTGAGSVSTGEPTSFHIDYANEEDTPLSAASFAISPVNSNLPIGRIAVSALTAGYEQSENRIDLTAPVPAHSRGGFDITLAFSEKIPQSEQAAGIAVKSGYSIGAQAVAVKSYSPAVKILSKVTVTSAGYYYSPQGDQIGAGPLPPEVGVPTRYWVFLNIDNHGNNLKDFTVTGTLAEGAVWLNSKNLLAGKLLYGVEGRKVVWAIDHIDKDGGNYRAGYEVAAIPEAGDAGKILPLVGAISYSYYDEYAGVEINGTLDPITTSLDNDLLASGMGAVRTSLDR